MDFSDDIAAGTDSKPDALEHGDARLVLAIAEGTDLRDELYTKYRRPLLQVFLQRRIHREAAQDLLQLTFLQAIKKIRAEGLDDPTNLGGYLYRTATKLATSYWRGELARPANGPSELLATLRDEAASLEERVDKQMLAKCIRELMNHLQLARDRDVLVRFYLYEEPKDAICRTLELTELQFNQVLWRARQRFGEILRQHGMATAAHCPVLVIVIACALVACETGRVFTIDDVDGATELHSSVSFAPQLDR
ncbi:MAG TPA: sigma-70 family RNA polymerase sigma factor [Steroidobacteraceae bacterium]